MSGICLRKGFLWVPYMEIEVVRDNYLQKQQQKTEQF